MSVSRLWHIKNCKIHIRQNDVVSTCVIRTTYEISSVLQRPERILSRHVFLTKIFLQITEKGEMFVIFHHKHLP